MQNPMFCRHTTKDISNLANQVDVSNIRGSRLTSLLTVCPPATLAFIRSSISRLSASNYKEITDKRAIKQSCNK